MRETAIGFDAIESAEIGADPDRSGRILRERPHIVVAECLQIVGDVTPVLEMQSVGFETIEARRFAAAPDASFAIDQQRSDVVAADRGRFGRIVAEHLEADAVVARESVLRSHPDEAVAILRQLVNRARRQSVGDRQADELRRRRRRRGRGDQHKCEKWQSQQSAHAPSLAAESATRARAPQLLAIDRGACLASCG